MRKSEALRYRQHIEIAVQSLPDNEALETVMLYPMWKSDTAHPAGQRVRYNGTLYKCLTAHTSQADWTPDAAPSLWAKVLIPDPDTVPEWEQPDSTNPYMQGDKVTHNGATWVSDIDNNVWTPGEYGWVEAE